MNPTRRRRTRGPGARREAERLVAQLAERSELALVVARAQRNGEPVPRRLTITAARGIASRTKTLTASIQEQTT